MLLPNITCTLLCSLLHTRTSHSNVSPAPHPGRSRTTLSTRTVKNASGAFTPVLCTLANCTVTASAAPADGLHTSLCVPSTKLTPPTTTTDAASKYVHAEATDAIVTFTPVCMPSGTSTRPSTSTTDPNDTAPASPDTAVPCALLVTLSTASSRVCTSKPTKASASYVDELPGCCSAVAG